MELLEKYSYSVYSLGSFSAAAKELFISQPALSSAISRHEKNLGFAIFDRSVIPISLTPEGRIYVEYLEEKEKEIEQYNTGHSGFNTRYLTNLGTFRMYAEHYLANNPNLRKDLLLFVRELAPTSSGVPLEIYCFSKEVNWVPYEKIQSDIMEHLLAVLPSFRLRVFQDCSDIYQEVGNQVDVVGGAFCFDKLENPVYPDNETPPAGGNS